MPKWASAPGGKTAHRSQQRVGRDRQWQHGPGQQQIGVESTAAHGRTETAPERAVGGDRQLGGDVAGPSPSTRDSARRPGRGARSGGPGDRRRQRRGRRRASAAGRGPDRPAVHRWWWRCAPAHRARSIGVRRRSPWRSCPDRAPCRSRRPGGSRARSAPRPGPWPAGSARAIRSPTNSVPLVSRTTGSCPAIAATVSGSHGSRNGSPPVTPSAVNPSARACTATASIVSAVSSRRAAAR